MSKAWDITSELQDACEEGEVLWTMCHEGTIEVCDDNREERDALEKAAVNFYQACLELKKWRLGSNERKERELRPIFGVGFAGGKYKY